MNLLCVAFYLLLDNAKCVTGKQARMLISFKTNIYINIFTLQEVHYLHEQLNEVCHRLCEVVTEAALLVVQHGLAQLQVGVHDEGTARRDGLVEGLAAQDHHGSLTLAYILRNNIKSGRGCELYVKLCSLYD